MENSTQLQTTENFLEESSQFFPGLTKAEEVVAWAGIAVGVLGLFAILLRLVMPLVRRKRQKKRGHKGGQLSVNGSTGQLLGSSSPSSSSRTSTLSLSSHGDTKSRDTLATISGSPDTKLTLYGYTGTDSSGTPVPVPQMKSGSSLNTPTPAQSALNQELSSVLSTTPTMQRLQSLHLDEVYRSNWDRTFDPNAPSSPGLSQYSHPSESRYIPDTVPRVHQPSPKTATSRNHAEQKTRF